MLTLLFLRALRLQCITSSSGKGHRATFINMEMSFVFLSEQTVRTLGASPFDSRHPIPETVFYNSTHSKPSVAPLGKGLPSPFQISRDGGAVATKAAIWFKTQGLARLCPRPQCQSGGERESALPCGATVRRRAIPSPPVLMPGAGGGGGAGGEARGGETLAWNPE